MELSLNGGISKGNKDDLYIDFSKNTTFSGIPICFDTFVQAINFCINSELFAGGFPNPVDLAPGEQYYDFSNIIAISAPIDSSVVLLDTGRFPEGKNIEDYVAGFKPGPDLDQEFSIVAEEDEFITAPRVLDITEVSRTLHLKTKGAGEIWIKRNICRTFYSDYGFYCFPVLFGRTVHDWSFRSGYNCSDWAGFTRSRKGSCRHRAGKM